MVKKRKPAPQRAHKSSSLTPMLVQLYGAKRVMGITRLQTAARVGMSFFLADLCKARCEFRPPEEASEGSSRVKLGAVPGAPGWRCVATPLLGEPLAQPRYEFDEAEFSSWYAEQAELKHRAFVQLCGKGLIRRTVTKPNGQIAEHLFTKNLLFSLQKLAHPAAEDCASQVRYDYCLVPTMVTPIDIDNPPELIDRNAVKFANYGFYTHLENIKYLEKFFEDTYPGLATSECMQLVVRTTNHSMESLSKH